MVELLLAGLVMGISSSSISGLFLASGMQFYRAGASISAGETPSGSGSEREYHRLIPPDQIPSNLLEVIYLGPEISKQFIAKKASISTLREGETVILPGYRNELALTQDAVLRIDLANPADPLNEAEYKTIYIAASKGCMTTTTRLASDGASGSELTIVTDLQWKISTAAFETLGSSLSTEGRSSPPTPLEYDEHRLAEASPEALVTEMKQLIPPTSDYEVKTLQHLFRQAKAAYLTKLASGTAKTTNTCMSVWTSTAESTPTFLYPNMPPEDFYKKVETYTNLLT